MRMFLLAVGVTLVVASAGCAQEPPASQPAAEVPPPVHEPPIIGNETPTPPAAGRDVAMLSRADWLEGRVVLNATSQWTALDVPIQAGWAQDGEIRFGVVNEASTAGAYLWVGVYLSGSGFPAQYLPYAWPDGMRSTEFSILMSDSPPGALHVGLFAGHTNGTATLSLGILEADAPASGLHTRPVLDVRPDHHGSSGFVGTFTRTLTDDGRVEETVAGSLDASSSVLLPGPSGARVGAVTTFTGTADAAVPGIAAFAFVSQETAMVVDWAYAARIGNTSWKDDGVWASAAGAHPSRLDGVGPFNAPITLASAPTGSGPATLQATVERHGIEGGTGTAADQGVPASPMLVSWGYLGADPAQLFGWG